MASQLPELFDYSKINYQYTAKASIPKRVLAQHRIITGLEPGLEVDAYRMLRTRVLHEMANNGWSTLAITSPTPGTGKSLTSINLSLSIAMDLSATVLLVDTDLRQPCVHRYFNLPANTPGLGDYLTKNIPLELLLINPQLGTFIMLPGGKDLYNSSEMLSSPKMQKLILEMKHRYHSRIVVFDIPPLLVADDAIALIPYVDAVLLVIEDEVTTKQELANAIDLLDGVNIIGTVLNKSKQKAKTYGYGYSRY